MKQEIGPSNQIAIRGIGWASSGVVDAIVHRVRKGRRETMARVHAAKKTVTVQERKDELVQFYNRYEEMVEAICDGAQYGPTPKLERIYQSEREWMLNNYAGVRAFVISFLTSDDEDRMVGMAVSGEPTDAFEALFVAETLNELLNADGGTMISRITRTREALVLYGEHLRQLEAAEGRKSDGRR